MKGRSKGRGGKGGRNAAPSIRVGRQRGAKVHFRGSRVI